MEMALRRGGGEAHAGAAVSPAPARVSAFLRKLLRAAGKLVRKAAPMVGKIAKGVASLLGQRR